MSETGMTMTSRFISIVAARGLDGGFALHFVNAHVSLPGGDVYHFRARHRGCTAKRNALRSRCCGEGRPNGFPERRFKDGDVLLNAATAYADARDQLALAGERRSAAH
jgi:hypothetical protein